MQRDWPIKPRAHKASLGALWSALLAQRWQMRLVPGHPVGRPSAIQTADFGKYGVELVRIFTRVVDQAADRLAHIGQVVGPDDLLEELDLARLKLNRVWLAIFHGVHLRWTRIVFLGNRGDKPSLDNNQTL